MNICGCATRRGAIVIAFLCLLHSIGIVVYCSLILAKVVSWRDCDVPQDQAGPKAVSRVALAMGILDLLASCLLISAAINGWRHMLLVWTTVKSSCITVAALFYILGLTAGLEVVATVVIGLDFVVQIAFILVVLRHYQELRDLHYLRKLARNNIIP